MKTKENDGFLTPKQDDRYKGDIIPPKEKNYANNSEQV